MPLLIISSSKPWSTLIPPGLIQLQCSKESMPASTAERMATVGCTCAATCFPNRWASTAATRNSSMLYWAARGLLPGVAFPPEPKILMQSAPPLMV